MSIAHNYKIIALLVICILAALGGYIFLVNRVWEKAGVIAEYKSDIVHGDQKKQYANTMLASFESIQEDIDRFKKILVQKQGEVEFIEYIEGLAQESGLGIEINNISIESPVDLAEQGMEYMSVRLEVEGSWASVWRFSQMLEVIPYSLRIQSVGLFKQDSESGTDISVFTWKGVYNIKVLKNK